MINDRDFVRGLDAGRVNPKPQQQRTITQNAALHKYFELVADRLNNAGLEKAVVLKGLEVPWSKESVKEDLWRPIQLAMLQKKSTTELTTKDIDPVFDTLNRHLAQFGITEAFPSIDEIMIKMAEPDYPQRTHFTE